MEETTAFRDGQVSLLEKMPNAQGAVAPEMLQGYVMRREERLPGRNTHQHDPPIGYVLGHQACEEFTVVFHVLDHVQEQYDIEELSGTRAREGKGRSRRTGKACQLLVGVVGVEADHPATLRHLLQERGGQVPVPGADVQDRGPLRQGTSPREHLTKEPTARHLPGMTSKRRLWDLYQVQAGRSPSQDRRAEDIRKLQPCGSQGDTLQGLRERRNVKWSRNVLDPISPAKYLLFAWLVRTGVLLGMRLARRFVGVKEPLDSAGYGLALSILILGAPGSWLARLTRNLPCAFVLLAMLMSVPLVLDVKRRLSMEASRVCGYVGSCCRSRCPRRSEPRHADASARRICFSYGIRPQTLGVG